MWIPNEIIISTLDRILINSSKADTNIQKNLKEELDGLCEIDDLYKYLIILIENKNYDLYIKTFALIIFKNNVPMKYDKLYSIDQNHINEFLLKNLCNTQICNHISNIISCLCIYSIGFTKFIIPRLFELLYSELSDYNCILDTMVKICGDVLECDNIFDINELLMETAEKLLVLLKNVELKYMHYILKCLSRLISYSSKIFNDIIKKLLVDLINIINLCDIDLNIRSEIVSIFLLLCDMDFNVLIPYLDNVFTFMINCSQYEDHNISFDVFEFWSSLIDHHASASVYINAILPQLIPLLISFMKYTDNDKNYIEYEENNANLDDSFDQDLHYSRDFDRMKYDPSDWTIRKCASLSIDRLAHIYGGVMLNYVDILTTMIYSDDWLSKEAAILALGAISLGCSSSIHDYFVYIYPTLLISLDHENALVRGITCWTLSRFTSFFMANDMHYIDNVVKKMLEKTVDRNKFVQSSTISALLTFIHAFKYKFIKYMPNIFDTISFCLQYYKSKNMVILYELIISIIELIIGASSHDVMNNSIMPLLVDRFLTEQYIDTYSFYILSQTISTSIKYKCPFVLQQIPKITKFCIAIIEQAMNQSLASSTDLNIQEPDDDIIISFIDIITTSISSIPLPSNYSQILTTLKVPCIISNCLNHPHQEIKQNISIAILQLIKYYPDLIEPYIKEIIMFLNSFKLNENLEYINRYIYTTLVIIDVLGTRSQPYLHFLLEKYISLILANKQLNDEILYNIILIYSQYTSLFPHQVVVYLPRIIETWIHFLIRIKHSQHKLKCIISLLNLISLDTINSIKYTHLIYELFSQITDPDSTLKTEFNRVINSFINSTSFEQWKLILSQINPDILESVFYNYGV